MPALQIEIVLALTWARIQRTAAISALRRSRRLSALAWTESDQLRANELNAKAQAAHIDGMKLRFKAEQGRAMRRCQALAAALLRGRTFRQCEPKGSGCPRVDILAQYLTPYLALNEQKHAVALVRTWIQTPESRLATIRAQGDFARLVAQDQTALEVTRLEDAIRNAVSALGQYSAAVTWAQKAATQAQQHLKDAQTEAKRAEDTLAALREQLRKLQTPTPAPVPRPKPNGQVQSIDDLFTDGPMQ